MASTEQSAGSAATIQHLEAQVSRLEAELLLARRQATAPGSDEALKRSERRYCALAQATAQAIWSLDHNGLSQQGSDWWEQLTGQSPASAAGWGWLDVVHSQDRAGVRQTWEQAVHQNKPCQSEFRVQDRLGQWRHLSARAIPVFDEAGRLIEWVGAFSDVSEHREVQAALASSEQRFRSILNLAAVGITEARFPGGGFALANPKIEEITGYSAAELLHLSYRDFTHPDDLPASDAAMQALFAGTVPSVSLEKRYIRRDGRIIWVNTHVSLLRDDSGRITGSVAAVEDITARKAAEAALARGNEKLHLVADSVPALISYIDRDLRYQFANRTYEEWFGISRAEVEGRTVAEVLGASAFEVLLPHMRRALAGETVFYEDWAPYRTGRRYIRVVYVPDADEAGQVQGFAVMVEDTTQAREAAERIAQLNQELQARVRDFEVLFETMPAGVAIARDADASDIRVNRTMARLLGFNTVDNASLTGASAGQLPFRVLRDGQDIPIADLPQQKAHRDGKPSEAEELEILRQDGHRFHLFGSAVPLFDETGGIRGSIAAFVDVSERRAAEEALRRSEQRLSRLIDSSPFGVAVSDFSGQTHYANSSFLRMVGYTIEDLEAGLVRWLDMTPPEWRQLDERSAVELRRTGMAVPYEKEYIRKDGTRVPILIGRCLLDEPYTDQEQVVAFYLDLTERKKSEVELRAANEELRRANHDLEEFAYAAAHDLQEPLRMVSLYTQLLRRRYSDQLDEPASAVMKQVTESATRAQMLVADLLAYTRIIHGEMDELCAEDANAVMAAVLNTLSALIQESGAVVTYDPLPLVTISHSHLLQLFQNLLGNAIKYARPGVPPVVHVSTRRLSSGHAFRVKDNGIGIDPAYQERIFGVFRRLHGSNVPGTGIGLAICRRIVERYGGQIWVESAGEGFGSTFVFTIRD